MAYRVENRLLEEYGALVGWVSVTRLVCHPICEGARCGPPPDEVAKTDSGAYAFAAPLLPEM